MGWEESLAFLNQAPKKVGDFSGYNANLGFQQFKSQLKFGVGGYDPYSATSSNWMSTFRAAKQKVGYTPAAFPESINVTLPYSSMAPKPFTPRGSTKGDILGSFGATFDNALWQNGYLNMANAPAWLEERAFVAAKAVADKVGGDGNLVSDAIDKFSEFFEAAAEPVDKVMSVFPNMVRDSQLNSRADIYKAFVTGQHVGLLQTALATGGDIARIGAVNHVVDLLSGGGSQNEIAQARALVAGLIDLPESVKRKIEQDPDGDIAKYLDEAPEGRMFSYVPGLGGAAANLGSMGLLYGLEILATGGVAGILRGAAGMVKGAEYIPSVVNVLGSGGSALGKAARIVAMTGAKGASTLAKVNKLLLATGINYFAASTLVETALRTMGDEAGVAYIDKVNRTALVSDSRAVQLASAFAVNPFSAVAGALKGQLKFVGLPVTIIDRASGRRLSTLYNHETVTLDILGKMYNTSRDGARGLIGGSKAGEAIPYETKGQAYDQIMGLAAEAFYNKLPAELKAAIDGLPRNQQTPAMFARYNKQIVEEMAHPDGLVAAFKSDFQYHDFYGNFDPEIAKLVTIAFRDAGEKYGAAMQRMDLVRGYVEFLNPEGQALVADKIAGAFAAGRQGTLRDLNVLSVEHPSLNGIVSDLVAKGANGKPFTNPTDVVPRGVFDEALARATMTYDTEKALHPFRVANGRDPILGARARTSEWAEALGTTEDTIDALNKATGRTPAQDGLIADFLREKNLVSEAELAAGKADDLYAKAKQHMDTTTEPWVRRGAEVDAAEAGLAEAGDKVDFLRNIKAGRKEIADAETEAAFFRDKLAVVRDPYTTYASAAKFAQGTEGAAMDVARRVLRAREQLAEITAIRAAVAPAQVFVATRGATLLNSVERGADGAWRWIAETRVTSGRLFDAAVAQYKAWAFKGKYNRPSLGRFENDTPPVGQAAQMADSDGFMRMLRGKEDEIAVVPEVAGAPPAPPVTYGEIADMVKANRRGVAVESEITQPMIDALGVTTREAFIAKLGSLRGAYDSVIDGSTLRLIEVTAGAKAEAWALKRAAASQPATLVPDYSSEAAHANNLWELKDALEGMSTGPAIRGVVEGDPRLLAQVREMAEGRGATATEFLDNPANKDAIKALLPDPMPERYVFADPLPATPLDEALLRGDAGALPALKAKLDEVWASVAEPLRDVPAEVVDRIARVPRLSTTLADDLNGAGIHWQALIPESLWAKSPAGAKALSYLMNGRFDLPPRTIQGLLSVLKDIENGNAARAGMGSQLATEAQQLGKRVVSDMIGDARKASLEIGVVGMGKMLNPYTQAADEARLMQDLFAQDNIGGLVTFRDSLGLQYGLKARPRGKTSPTGEVITSPALAVDMELVPGLAEELLMGRFQPWYERLGAVRTQQAFSRLFHISNQQVMFEARGRFEKRMAEYGVPGKAAEQVWTAWRNYAKSSREAAWSGGGGWKKGPGGTRVWQEGTPPPVAGPGKGARYGTEKNIPNWELRKVAREALDDYYRDLGGIPDSVASVNMAEEMRIAGSFTRRQLEKAPVMGDFLQKTYGMFAHNEWVTTKYFQFRFALDPRFHAMNWAEPAILYYGHTGLKVAEIDKGMFGMTRGVVKQGAGEAAYNTSYPFFSGPREEFIYRWMLKTQPDALRGVVAADPALFRRGLLELAKADPELSRTIAAMGDNPTEWLRLMDAQWGKLMRSTDPAAVVERELQRDLVNMPEMAEIYSRIYDANQTLLADIRSMMYGNPNRGQIERVLNSFLLYWPISYQIKASKWLVKILYGKIGGVQTGGLGALTLDRMQADHEQRLLEDPEYVKFFENNQALIFAAQMIIPMSPGSMGVSLSPVIRDLFFAGTKQVGSMGPVYTITKFIPSVAGDLYPYLKDLPFVDEAYKAATGWAAPKEKAPKGFVPLAP